MLNKICPKCGKETLEINSVLLSYPSFSVIVCRSCDFSERHECEDEILILSGEEAVAKRPELYVDSDNPEWRELAKKILSNRRILEERST